LIHWGSLKLCRAHRLKKIMLLGHGFLTYAQSMYLPPQFKGQDAQAALLIQQYPFASLISSDNEGLPFVTHLPLHLEQRDDSFVLLGHVAKANPHWRHLQARPQAVVTFLGPHAYMSPKVYPDLVRVPTWNYLAVHCSISASLIHDAPAKDALLKKLIADNEPAFAAQWQNMMPEYAEKMLAGIVAFELNVTGLQCKLKLNQHRPEAFDAMHTAYAKGSDDERALALWMDKVRQQS
jgi:transcriptional regulator